MRVKSLSILGKVFYVVLLSLTFLACQPGDDKLAANVKSSISMIDPAIQVAVKDGVVTLSGEVEDQSKKTAAENAIKEIKGIKNVVNNISVKEEAVSPVTINPDTAIRNSIDSGFTKNNITGVQVAVVDGVVTLTGNVKRSNLVKVMQAANEAKPKRVINQLTISNK